MYEIRTDLALEAHEINAQAGREDGIRTEEETIDGFSITTVHVGEGEGERLAKKKAGTYINVDVGKSWLLASEGFAALVALLAGQLRKLFPADFSGTALVVGLGNYDITADSIGPKAVEKVVVTRHLRTLNPQLYESAGFGDLCAFAPGVLGQTGMESAEIVRSIVEAVRPSLIVAIDALASRRLARLATTVQLCDTGIYPGAVQPAQRAVRRDAGRAGNFHRRADGGRRGHAGLRPAGRERRRKDHRRAAGRRRKGHVHHAQGERRHHQADGAASGLCNQPRVSRRAERGGNGRAAGIKPVPRAYIS